ncbi:hypothetical protein B0H13DRAFT_1877672 [Mycena leptocephala]|nr:hypothetical protein B0H13DRAFT_1877672 [Mycena leptocephala]
MSDTNSTNYLENKSTKTEITNRRRRASQENHSERLRATARLQMQSLRLHAEMENNEHKKEWAQEHCREIDAEYREVKVIKNHGINAYMDDYVPLLNEFNSYRLVKVKFKLSKDEKEAENGSGEDEGEE